MIDSHLHSGITQREAFTNIHMQHTLLSSFSVGLPQFTSRKQTFRLAKQGLQQTRHILLSSGTRRFQVTGMSGLFIKLERPGSGDHPNIKYRVNRRTEYTQNTNNIAN
jgi:hypothetical protein